MSEAPDGPHRADLEAGGGGDGSGGEAAVGYDDGDAAREVTTSQPGAPATPSAEQDKALSSGAEVPATPPRKLRRSFAYFRWTWVCKFRRTTLLCRSPRVPFIIKCLLRIYNAYPISPSRIEFINCIAGG